MTRRSLLTFRQLAGDRDNFEFHNQTYDIIAPDDFKLVPLARLNLAIEGFETGLSGTPEEVKAALESVDWMVGEICPDLAANQAVYQTLEHLDKMEIIQAFLSLGQEDEDGPTALESGEAVEPPKPTDWGDAIPRLQKFYGGRPQDWLELTMRWLKCFNRMLPVLKAESILELGQGVFTGGWPTDEQHREAIEKMINQLNRLSRPDEEIEFSLEEFGNQMMKIGFKRRHVEADEE